MNGRGLVYFVELETGKILWQFDKIVEEIGRFYTISSMPNLDLFMIGVYGHYGRPDRILVFNKNEKIFISDQK